MATTSTATPPAATPTPAVGVLSSITPPSDTDAIAAIVADAKTHLVDGKFCDPLFPADLTSIYSTFTGSPLRAIADKLVWLRPSEFTDAPALEVDGTTYTDVIQGDLRDSYFLGAVACAANRPELIKNILVDYQLDIGLFICRFWKNGSWMPVCVDDRLPCTADRKPAFARCKDPNEQWVSLLEKAYAKVHGSYHGIISGNVLYAFSDLTSGAGEVLKWPSKERRKEDREKLWAAITYAINRGWLLGCSSSLSNLPEEEMQQTGLMAKHTYTLIYATSVTRGDKKTNLIKIRNPWGQREWTGKWSDGSPLWTPEIKEQLHQVDADDGTFWIRVKDFARWFTKLYICRLYSEKCVDPHYHYIFRDEWKGETAGGCPNNPTTWYKNPQFGIQSDDDQPMLCFVVLSQEDLRIGTGKDDGKTIGLNIFEAKVPARPIAPATRKTRVFQSDPFTNDRDETAKFEIKPRVPYIVIPSTFDPGHERKFTLRFFTPRPVKVFQLGPAKEEHMTMPPSDAPEAPKKTAVVLGADVDPSLCLRCKKPTLTTQKLLKAVGRMWHFECFVCAECKKPFPSNKFFARNNEVMCQPCAQAQLRSAEKCGVCKKPLTQPYVTLEEGQKIHSDCFVCHHCKVKITGSYCKKDGKLYCSEDFQKIFAVLCYACKQNVLGTQFVKTLKRTYHESCFKCYNCKGPLKSGEFYQISNEPFCDKCVDLIDEEQQRELEKKEAAEAQQEAEAAQKLKEEAEQKAKEAQERKDKEEAERKVKEKEEADRKEKEREEAERNAATPEPPPVAKPDHDEHEHHDEPKHEEHHDEPKPEHHDEPKPEEHHDEPKPEEHHDEPKPEHDEPKPEHHYEPKHEEHHEPEHHDDHKPDHEHHDEPKHEEHHEPEHHDEPKPEHHDDHKPDHEHHDEPKHEEHHEPEHKPEHDEHKPDEHADEHHKDHDHDEHKPEHDHHDEHKPDHHEHPDKHKSDYDFKSSLDRKKRVKELSLEALRHRQKAADHKEESAKEWENVSELVIALKDLRAKRITTALLRE
ncbi:calpain-1 catalytic subunit [Pelomyxa schiedti]|nr:calpain-1 catalytic subunit [Pelomyxa schiedti]